MDPWLIIGPVVFIGVVVVVVKYFIGMNKIPKEVKFTGKDVDYEAAAEWQRKVWDQIDREKKAKERKEKAKRYWEGYDD